MSEWHYGHFDCASAVVAGGRLLVRVHGARPAGDVEVLLSPYPHDPDSTADVQMGLYWRGDDEPPPGTRMPFTARANVDVRRMDAPTLRIYHASGFLNVKVRHASRGPDLPLLPRAGCGRPDGS